VAGVGGAWALAKPDAAIIAQERKSECLIRIPIKRATRTEVPPEHSAIFRA
jgi:hypothetical protein